MPTASSALLAAGQPRDHDRARADDLVIITGISGAGRSVAAAHLEDLGWLTISKVPAGLAPLLLEQIGASQSPASRIALEVAAVGPDAQPALARARAAAIRSCVVFLDAAVDALVRRYSATRRRHPMSGSGGEGGDQNLIAAIERERLQLEPVKAAADVVLDTSQLSPSAMRGLLAARFGQQDSIQPTGTLRITLLSFGYKHGLPLDADLVFDCRFLLNPYWVESLRPLSGLDPEVRDYLLAQDSAPAFLGHAENMMRDLIPVYATTGRAYLTVAIGCTGGRHRSVAMAEALAGRLRNAGVPLSVTHRDVDL